MQQDTSLKKYPHQKYYNSKEIKELSKKMFQDKARYETIDVNQSTKGLKKRGKTQSISKAMSSCKVNNSYNHKNRSTHQNIATISPQNINNFSKSDIGQQLFRYQQLCLELRKQNSTLRSQLNQSKSFNKERLSDINKKVDKLQSKSFISKDKDKVRSKNKRCDSISSELKRFFLTFIDKFGEIDEKLHRQIQKQKLQRNIVLGQKIIKESTQFLKQKKYKFNCIFQ